MSSQTSGPFAACAPPAATAAAAPRPVRVMRRVTPELFRRLLWCIARRGLLASCDQYRPSRPCAGNAVECRMSGDDAFNMRLIAHDTLAGHGGVGEGMSLQLAKDGRRILWLAHESAPKNFTGVDVSDPRKPRVIVQTELPKSFMRSNSLELSGDIMAVAYQTQKVGQRPAGFELFDVSTPEKPRSIALVDCSGPHSRGVH